MTNKYTSEWTDDAIDTLERLYADTQTAVIAGILGFPMAAVYQKARRLGLRKSAEFSASAASGRFRMKENSGRETRFEPGRQPLNKGVNFKSGWRSGETRFQKGNRSGVAVTRYRPIGSERISKNGYLERKINDDLPRHKRWKLLHLIIYEEAHGKLPEGQIVTFKDGNPLNVAIDNLVATTRVDLMRSNSIHNYGPEISYLMMLRGQIIRKINRTIKNG